MKKKGKNADAKTADGAAAEAEKAPRSKKKILLLIVGAAAVFFAGGKVQGQGKVKTVVKVVYTTTTLPLGPVVSLDAITMNLADGHLLKIGVSFQLEHTKGSSGGSHGESSSTDNDPTKGYARALDIVIDELGNHTMEELTGKGREHAKEKLVERLEEEYHGEIEDIYFHQFVMQ